MHDNFSIIMKAGRENEPTTIDNVEGIVVPMLDGRQFLVKPKYGRDLELLERAQIEHYRGDCFDECEALYSNWNEEETCALARCGSPAAKWVRDLDMYLPSLQMCFAIWHNRERINDAATLIEGADQLEDGTYFWASCQCNTYGAWFFVGSNGRTSSSYFCYGFTAVPVAEIDLTKHSNEH